MAAFAGLRLERGLGNEEFHSHEKRAEKERDNKKEEEEEEVEEDEAGKHVC